MDTLLYRVRAGQVLPHQGEDLPAGTRVDLLPHVAAEIAHLVERIGADGRPLPPPSTLELDLARARPHERISLLQAERAVVAARLEELDEAIEREQAAGSRQEPTEN